MASSNAGAIPRPRHRWNVTAEWSVERLELRVCRESTPSSEQLWHPAASAGFAVQRAAQEATGDQELLRCKTRAVADSPPADLLALLRLWQSLEAIERCA